MMGRIVHTSANGSVCTTLGLTEDAVVIEENETPFIHNEIISIN